MMSPQIDVVMGDLTRDDSEAIVNAANSSLLGGGGVDGAIHRAGGRTILAACREVRQRQYPDGLPTGEAVATTGGALTARYVIHTVGPIHSEHPVDGGAQLLAACHRNSLDVADALGVTSIAFPAISCGVYGWSAHDAAPIAVRAVREWYTEHPEGSVQRVRFVLFNDDASAAFLRARDAK